MKAKLIGGPALIELVLLILLFYLLKQPELPGTIAVILVFLLPISYGLHIVEEFALPGGFTEWNKAYRPKFADALTSSYLFKVNAIPGIAACLVPLGAFDYLGGYSFWGIRAWHVFLSILAFNGLYHIRGAIQTRQYCPGMLTSLVFYAPLTIVGFGYFLNTGVLDIFSAVVCLAIGSVFQSVLDRLKARNMKNAGMPA